MDPEFQRNASDAGEVVEGIANGGRDEGWAKCCPVKNASHAGSNLKVWRGK
jgi:hypothetical protein